MGVAVMVPGPQVAGLGGGHEEAKQVAMMAETEEVMAEAATAVVMEAAVMEAEVTVAEVMGR